MDGNEIIELDDNLNPKGKKEEVIELDDNLNPITEKKNPNLESSSIGEGNKSESEIPSISKIKQDNSTQVNLDKSKILKERIAQDLPKMGKSARESYINTLVKKGYDENALNDYAKSLNLPDTRTEQEKKFDEISANQTPEEKAKLEEHFQETQQPKGFVGELLNDASQGMEAGTKQTLNAIKGIAETMQYNNKPVTTKIKDLASETIKGTAGAANTVFATMGVANPELAAFNAVTKGIKEMPVAAKKAIVGSVSPTMLLEPDEKAAEHFDKLIDLPFAAAATIVEEAGYKPKEGSTGKAALDILNLLIPLGAAKAGVGASEHIKSAEDLKNISQKIADNTATKDETKAYFDVSKGIGEVTTEEVKNAADEKSKELPVQHDELHTKLAELQAKTQEDGFDTLPPEVQDGIFNDIKSTQNEINQKNTEEIDSHINDAKNEAKIADLDAKIASAEKELENASPSVKESIQTTINNLKAEKNGPISERGTNEILQREQEKVGEQGGKRGGMEQVIQGDEVTKTDKTEEGKAKVETPTLSKEQVIEDLIQKGIDEGDFEEGSPEEAVVRKVLDKRFESQKELGDAVEEIRKADEQDTAESVIKEAPVKTDEGYKYKTSRTEYTAKLENGELKITDSKGKEPSQKTKLAITKDYEKRFDYTKGKSAFEGLKEGDVGSEEEADRMVADKSENPNEIMQVHERLLQDKPYEKGDHIENVIAENINKVTRGSHMNFGDRNNIVFTKAKAYFNKEGRQIDDLAQELSHEAGVEVTPQDIVDFIDKYPNGVSDYNKAMRNPLIAQLKDRFKKVTGLTLNDRVLEASFNQNEQRIINEKYIDDEEFKKELDRAYEAGELEPPPFDQEAENVSTDAVQKGEGTGKEKPAVKEEKKPSEENTIGTTQAKVNESREERGLMPFEKSMREGNEERWDKVQKQIEQGKVDPKSIAKSVVDGNKKILTADEVAALDYHRIQLQEQRNGAMEQIEKAQESGDKTSELDGQLRLEAYNEDIALNDRAAFLSSSEWGRSGQMRQRLFKSDYSMVAMERKVKIANGGKELTKPQLDRIKELSEELEAQAKVIDDLQQEKSRKDAQKVIDEIAMEQKIKEGIEAESNKISEQFFSKETKAKVDKAFDDILNGLNGKAFSSIIPLPVLKGAVKLVKTLVLRGMDLTNAIKKGIDYIKENHKDEFDENKFTGLFGGLKEHVKTKPGKSHSTEGILSAAKKRAVSKGKLPGLNGLLKKYVSEGITDTDKMVDKVYDDFKNDIPGLTKREVRDEISGYGKVTKLSEDEINVSLRKLKRVGSLMSALEDAHENRIKRTGLQRDLPSDKEIELRKQINAAMRENQLSGEQNPKSDMEWKSLLDKYKKRLEKKTSDLEDKIGRGDYAKKVKVPLLLDQEAIDAKKKYEKLKDKATLEIKKIEKANRGIPEKVKDNFLKYRRAMILSSLTTTVGKLGVAAFTRTFITNPIEAVIAAGWSKIPVVRDIAREAPRYGGPLNTTALAKGFAEWVKKETWKDTLDILKGEKGELSLIHGKGDELPGGILDIFNQIHKGIKNPAKRAAFQTSLEIRMANAIRNGENAYDPQVQARIMGESYEDSNRAVYLQKNKITSGYEMFVRNMENKAKDGSVTGQMVAFVTRFLLPIVKVPTNFVAEQREYIAGVTNIQVALRKGIDKLSPEERDHVIRGLTRQTMGAGLLLLGYYGYKNFGGYYVKEKKEEDGSSPDDMELFGVKIPHWAQHVPALQTIQFGSTIRRVQEYYKRTAEKKGVPVDKGFGTGLAAATVGTLEHVPFLETPGQLLEALKTPEGRDKWVGEVAKSLAIPPDLQKLAQYLDKDLDGNEIKRKPKGFLEVIEMGIPGMRERVGTAYDEVMNERSNPSSDEALILRILAEKDEDKRKELQEQLIEQKSNRRDVRTDKNVKREQELMKLGKALGKPYIAPKGQTNLEKYKLSLPVTK